MTNQMHCWSARDCVQKLREVGEVRREFHDDDVRVKGVRNER